MGYLIRLVAVVAALISSPACAALVLSHADQSSTDGAVVDGTNGVNEYNGYSYTGGGTGFGGPVGNGTIYMDSSAVSFPGSLFVGAQIAGDLGSNIMAIFLDTRPGGFTNDSALGDFSDGGRKVASKLTIDVQDNFPIGADFVLEFGNGFTNLFELKTGSLNFISTTAAGTGGNGGAGFREVAIPLSTLGMIAGQSVDFFGTLVSDTGFASNEGIPNQGIGSNPGFNNSGNGGGPVTWSNFDRFTTAPEPTTVVVWGFVLMSAAFIGRRNKNEIVGLTF